MEQNLEKESYYVGQGLKNRTYEECLAEGLNPNPNPPGRIRLMGDKESMREHVKREKELVLKALKIGVLPEFEGSKDKERQSTLKDTRKYFSERFYDVNAMEEHIERSRKELMEVLKS